MYVLRNRTKNKCYIKKLQTSRQKQTFFPSEVSNRNCVPSPLAKEFSLLFPPLKATHCTFCRWLPPFIPAKTQAVVGSITSSDGILKFHRQILSDEWKIDNPFPSLIPLLKSNFRRYSALFLHRFCRYMDFSVNQSQRYMPEIHNSIGHTPGLPMI